MSMCSIIEEVVSKLRENERLVLIGEKFRVGIYKHFGVHVADVNSLWVTSDVEFEGLYMKVRERKYRKADLELDNLDKTHIIMYSSILHMELVKDDVFKESDIMYKNRLHEKEVMKVDNRAIEIVANIDEDCICELIGSLTPGEYLIKYPAVSSNYDVKNQYDLDLENNKKYSDIRVVSVELRHRENEKEDECIDLLVDTISDTYVNISDMDNGRIREVVEEMIAY